MEIYREKEETRCREEIRKDRTRYLKVVHTEKYIERPIPNRKSIFPASKTPENMRNQKTAFSHHSKSPESTVKKDYCSWDKKWELHDDYDEPVSRRRFAEVNATVNQKDSPQYTPWKWEVAYDNRNFIRSKVNDVKGTYSTARPENKWEILCNDNRNYVKSFLSESMLLDNQNTDRTSEIGMSEGSISNKSGHDPKAQTSNETIDEYLDSLQSQESPEVEFPDDFTHVSDESKKENLFPTTPEPSHSGHTEADFPDGSGITQTDFQHDVNKTQEKSDVYTSTTTTVTRKCSVQNTSAENPLASDRISDTFRAEPVQIYETETRTVALNQPENHSKTEINEDHVLPPRSGVFHAQTTSGENEAKGDQRDDVGRRPPDGTRHDEIPSIIEISVPSDGGSKFRDRNMTFPMHSVRNNYEIHKCDSHENVQSLVSKDLDGVRICEICSKKCHCKRDEGESICPTEKSSSVYGSQLLDRDFSVNTWRFYPSETETDPRYRYQGRMEQRSASCPPPWQTAYNYGGISRNDTIKENDNYIVCKCEPKNRRRRLRNKLIISMNPLPSKEYEASNVDPSVPRHRTSVKQQTKQSEHVTCEGIYTIPYSVIRVQSDCSIWSEDGDTGYVDSSEHGSSTPRSIPIEVERKLAIENGSTNTIFHNADSPVTSGDEDYHSAEEITYDTTHGEHMVSGESLRCGCGRVSPQNIYQAYQKTNEEPRDAKDQLEDKDKDKEDASEPETPVKTPQEPTGVPNPIADDAIKVENVPSQEHFDFKNYVSSWPV